MEKMKREKILFVNACARPESRTCELAKCLLEHMEGDVCELNLYREKIQPIDFEGLEARKQNLKKGCTDHPDFEHARRFAEADEIVIAAPYWDLLFPAVLRSYLEAVTVTGITFAYSEAGIPVGMCRAKRLYYVTTAGGWIGKYNFGYDYVKALAQVFYGIPEIRFVSAEGLDICGADVGSIMNKAKAAIAEL